MGKGVLMLSCLFAAMFITVIFATGMNYGTEAMRQEAVKRGFAEYRPQTGAWQWKEPLTAGGDVGTK